MSKLEIIHQDQDLLVVNKPPGLLSVPGRGPDKQDCVISRVLQQFANARVVHRLDMATSGLLIIPLNHATQVAIGRQFEARTVGKRYIALVDGLVKADQGHIKLPLICDWPNRPRQMVDLDNGKSADTEFIVLERNESSNHTRLELIPHTGRSHQLRVHCLSMGHVILGDSLYAEGEALAKSKRLCLHAESITFTHPGSGEPLSVSTPCPF